jgi:Fe2+ transport system protein FeoA
VPPGGSCVVRRIDEHLQTLVPRMQELERAGLLPGTPVVVSESGDGRLQLEVSGRTVDLDTAVAAEVYVSV